MNTLHALDPCTRHPGAGCDCTPAEFVRLRYFFGQRLGVVDLFDEQAYLMGKQRLHNRRAHGVGVLCGLRAERYSAAQGTDGSAATTLLRVRRGAALDACGREIVVGWDQCIDVAAWLAQHPAALANADGGGTLRLWVALCYRECPSDPAPAPRDPCGCDAGGCEFARIREGFQLLLLTEADAKLLAPKPGAAQALLLQALAGDRDLSTDTADWAGLVARLGGLDCPDAPDDPCLLLARVDATLDATGKTVADIGEPDNAVPERQTLLSTALLQQGLLSALQAVAAAGLTGGGPGWGAVSFGDATADAGTLTVDVRSQDAELSRDPLQSPALLKVSVARFLDDGSWADAAPDSVSYVAGPAAQLKLHWTAGLADGGLATSVRYRLLLQLDAAMPPVDTLMRPLAPPAWSRHLRLVQDAGVLTLADALYD